MSNCDVVSASVVIPTVGRPGHLDACLASVQACEPRAAEVIVVDQSSSSRIAEIAAHHGVRYVPSRTRGAGAARNHGIREARHELVLATDDDCTVQRDWVGVAMALLRGSAETVLTGRVRPEGDRRLVPSFKDDPVAETFTGKPRFDVLYPNNMAVNRTGFLGIGGFDERFRTAAEDNDFVYRWLRCGATVRYEPRMVVWHHEWRTRRELVSLYRGYSRGQGEVYAKHLRAGDSAILALLARDVVSATRGQLRAAVLQCPRSEDPRPRLWLGLVPGFLSGLRRFKPRV